MRYRTFYSRFFALAVITLLCVNDEARAYVDPSSTHIALQFILAAGIGLLFYVKAIFRSITGMFGCDKSKSHEDKSPGSETPVEVTKGKDFAADGK